MGAIYKRELRSYFSSMVGYVFLASVLIFLGVYFYIYNLTSGMQSYAKYVIGGGGLVIFILGIPLLTMKSFAEERKTKTDQLLLTYPVSVTGIVLGKFLSAITVVGVAVLITCFCPLVIYFNGYCPLVTDYCSIFAIYLMLCMFTSIGIFISSLTENQIIAAVISVVALLLLYIWNNIVNLIPQTGFASLIGFYVFAIILAVVVFSLSRSKLLTFIVAAVSAVVITCVYLVSPGLFDNLVPTMLRSFSCTFIIDNFIQFKMIDIGGLFFYVSMSAMFLFLTGQSIQKRRWS